MSIERLVNFTRWDVCWIPSVLFLTHYLPNDLYENDSMAVGSLILGQNGIWGDLPSISAEGVDYFGKKLALYKQMNEDITAATMTQFEKTEEKIIFYSVK